MSQPSREQQFLEYFGQTLGLYVSGDFGDMTIYTNKRGKIVWYPRAPPTCPPTPKQIWARARFRMAQRAWMAETTAVRAAWEYMTKKLSLELTGQNAYMSQALSPDPGTLATANKRAGTSLAMPTPIQQ